MAEDIPWWQKLVEQAGTTYAQVTAVKSAQKIADINAQRIKQGLRPLSEYEIQSMLPAAGVTVGMSPDMKRMLIYGGVGLAAVILLSVMIMRKR